MNKREFLQEASFSSPPRACCGVPAARRRGRTAAAPDADDYDPTRHWYGMGIDVDKCIGCNRCVEACKAENGVPDEPFFFRTWIERYSIHADGETTVECISTRRAPPEQAPPEDPAVVRTFFVPKLCNQCAHPPCVQVCPVGATFQTRDGVVLVDEKRCIGCRYCIQACPVRGPLPESEDANGRQVHVLLPPHHQGPAAGLCRGVPDRGADLRRPEGPGRPPGALPARQP